MTRKVTSYRLPEMTLNQIKALTESTGSSDANVIAFAIDRMFQQELPRMTTYINTDERYGEQVEVALADYQALNPDAKFVEIHGEIRELLSDTPGDYDVVAVAQDIIETQRQRDQMLDEYSKTQ